MLKARDEEYPEENIRRSFLSRIIGPFQLSHVKSCIKLARRKSAELFLIPQSFTEDYNPRKWEDA